MKITTIAEYSADAAIAKRNKAFEKATTLQKRVLIAKDVLARISFNQYKPKTSIWLRINPAHISSSEEQDSVQKMIVKEGIECKVCAMGGLAASCIGFNNSVTISEDFNTDNPHHYTTIDEELHLAELLHGAKEDKFQLIAIFGKTEIEKIEMTFEMGRGYYRNNLSDDPLKQKCILFGEKYKNDNRERMIAIMNNIVKNKGVFKP